ncbi:uncharacterized protein DS421_1g17610 [Arachis hypogaea]|nr:uncharacterized protein DS421_1g17610 [Arachis hypogaea]
MEREGPWTEASPSPKAALSPLFPCPPTTLLLSQIEPPRRGGKGVTPRLAAVAALKRDCSGCRRARMRRENDAGIEREAEVVWRSEGGGLFRLPFTPPKLSRSAATAPMTATARVYRCHLTTTGKHRGNRGNGA